MSWSYGLSGFALLFAFAFPVKTPAQANDAGLWREFGLVQQSTAKVGSADLALYCMKDLTGAIAAWEWQRSAAWHPCPFQAFCSTDGTHYSIASANYFINLTGSVDPGQLDAFLSRLPQRHETSLPPILNYLPRKDRVSNSARYILGSESMRAFAPELNSLQAGFDQGAEAQVADYRQAGGGRLRLAIFYYPTPEMARIHFGKVQRIPGVISKRSTFLVALVFGPYSTPAATAILNQIAFEAKVTWNDTPPPNPIKPLYQLFWNIIYLSGVLVALCLLSGLIYAGIRLYRRRFGTLEEDEAMTTLHLSGR